MDEPEISPAQNALNAILMVAVALPAVYAGSLVTTDCFANASGLYTGPLTNLNDTTNAFCRLGLNHPIAFVNLVFFLNVCVLFWIISLLQGSTWLIDPYWTIIPPLIAVFYHFHPKAEAEPTRALTVLVLTFVWSIRLTHSYFRRENYCFGVREDWRFSDMKRKNPKTWWWLSFFAAFVSQQPMLVGITLPLWAVNFHHGPRFGTVDIVATALCLTGMTISYFADTQLREFMLANEERAKKHQKKVLILDTGIWKYSRHPNYFGEQLWWWSLVIFAHHVGQGWTVVGTAFNTAIMMQVTVLTEARMLAQSHRAAAFRDYRKRTSVWLPWFPGKKDKVED